ncbi:DUF2835 domain-containing protein [uncultured Desulfuromonas sp.]|uniref:DUF2835 domain-containing protein n=1 Tax=uncultured Desulfuromonas sp. TaxID=181013 RepID=UPI002AABDC84|nr:DUF2835 domain-containing protein [uncultured Desulfuromonas sp.]
MTRTTFSLNISVDNYLRYYQGSATWIRIQADNGQMLKLPASNFRKFLTHSGIHGRFMIEFDDQLKLVGLTKL